jgi:hypothetical protein
MYMCHEDVEWEGLGRVRIGKGDRLFEFCNEPSSFIKLEEFSDYLRSFSRRALPRWSVVSW